MTKLRVKLKEPQRVYPKVIVVAATECRVDHSLYRWITLAGGSPAGRGLDMDRRHRHSRHRHSTWLLVATASPRLLVRGGAS